MTALRSRFLCILVLLSVAVLMYTAITEWKLATYYQRIGEQTEVQGYSWKSSDGQIHSGSTFTLPDHLLDHMRIPLTSFITLNRTTLKNFVFVTGSSSNHFAESLAMVESVQRHFPGRTLYFFDLGLRRDQVRKVKSWCDVTYKIFDMKEYPPHVTNLYFYGFKPLVILEILRQHDGVFYIDSSVRFKTGNFKAVYEMATKTGGVLHFSHTGHSIYATTEPRMYKYLVTDIEKAKRTEMTEGGVILLYRTQVVYERFFHWWLLCALDVECIAPRGASMNCGTHILWDKFRGCHRFDQSAASILLANMNDFNVSSYATVYNRYLIVDRQKRNVNPGVC